MDTITLGEILYSLRVNANLTQATLAQKSNVSRSTISKIENNLSFPKKETFHSIFYALDSTGIYDEIEDRLYSESKKKYKKDNFKGGKQNQRDRTGRDILTKDHHFKRWYHKNYKDGDDATREEMEAAYKQWEVEGYPKVKLLTREEIENLLRSIY